MSTKVSIELNRSQLVRLLQDQEHIHTYFDFPNREARLQTMSKLRKALNALRTQPNRDK